jgi:hypothetical protein
MRYFIHIVTDSERIVDPDGEDFADLGSARSEASQSARELMAGELTAGRPVPFGWRVHITDVHDQVLLAIPFAALVFGDSPPYSAQYKFPRVATPELVERARATMHKADRANGDLRHGLMELWSQLRTLSRMNADLSRKLS